MAMQGNEVMINVYVSLEKYLQIYKHISWLFCTKPKNVTLGDREGAQYYMTVGRGLSRRWEECTIKSYNCKEMGIGEAMVRAGALGVGVFVCVGGHWNGG